MVGGTQRGRRPTLLLHAARARFIGILGGETTVFDVPLLCAILGLQAAREWFYCADEAVERVLDKEMVEDYRAQPHVRQAHASKFYVQKDKDSAIMHSDICKTATFDKENCATIMFVLFSKLTLHLHQSKG